MAISYTVIGMVNTVVLAVAVVCVCLVGSVVAYEVISTYVLPAGGNNADSNSTGAPYGDLYSDSPYGTGTDNQTVNTIIGEPSSSP